MRETELEQMSLQPLFAGVDPERVVRLLKLSFLQRFPPFIELVREGDPADFLHLVIDGQVEVFASHNGRETTMSILTTGSTFILAAVMTDRPYLKSVRSLIPSKILLMPAEAVREIAHTDNVFAFRLFTELATAYRSVVKELKNQKLRSVIERLANWLIRADIEQGGSGMVQVPFEKKVLAARLGTSPEVLSRSFSALVPYGVQVDGSRILLNDLPALRNLAKPTALIDDPDY